jgi:hypothetical protein
VALRANRVRNMDAQAHQGRIGSRRGPSTPPHHDLSCYFPRVSSSGKSSDDCSHAAEPYAGDLGHGNLSSKLGRKAQSEKFICRLDGEVSIGGQPTSQAAARAERSCKRPVVPSRRWTLIWGRTGKPRERHPPISATLRLRRSAWGPDREDDPRSARGTMDTGAWDSRSLTTY